MLTEMRDRLVVFISHGRIDSVRVKRGRCRAIIRVNGKGRNDQILTDILDDPSPLWLIQLLAKTYPALYLVESSV